MTGAAKTLRGRRDTGAARLPGLPAVSTGNAQLDAWITAASERLEVREGQRGSQWERAVTQRELSALSERLDALQAQPDKGEGGDGASIVISVGAMQATMAISQFEDALRATRLYQEMKKRLDDPSRFDDLRAEVRDELLRDLREMALQQGAKVEQVERLVHDMNLNIAMKIGRVTATAEDAAAAVQELTFASAELDRAQAGKIVQLEASLGNYYQDGTPGRASLQESMTVTADRLDGLAGQYTLKVQAGGAIAGFGLAATEKDGEPDSAFIVAANKFAVVNPETWSVGLTNTPDAAHIPFGVDAGGIYLNHNVYVRGQMRVDTGGKTLADGLRGSLDIEGYGESWRDTAARNAIWQALGNPDSAPNNNHLVIGDTVNIGGTVRQWMGERWEAPGVVINGDMLVTGSVAADKIDTRGLTIKDTEGNVILGAGSGLPASYITGAVNITPNAAGSQVSINGQRVAAADLVSRLNRISSSNIGTFMNAAAITTAYIGTAQVDTLRIKGNAVTVPFVAVRSGFHEGSGIEVYHTYLEANASLPQAGSLFVFAVINIGTWAQGWGYAGSRLLINGNSVNADAIDSGYFMGVHFYKMDVAANQNVNIKLQFYGGKHRDHFMRATYGMIQALGVMR